MLSTSERYLIWFLAGALTAAAAAWIAFQLQQERFAPMILFPLLVGGGLGAAGAMVRHLTHVPGTRAAVAAAVGWGLLVVIGQDYIGHRHRLRQYDEQLVRQAPTVAATMPEVAKLRPRFDDYLAGVVRREPLWWLLELVLTSGAAGIAVGVGARIDRSTSSFR